MLPMPPPRTAKDSKQRGSISLARRSQDGGNPGCGKTTIVILSRSVAKAKNPCFVRLRPFACAQGDNHVSRRRLFQHPGAI